MRFEDVIGHHDIKRRLRDMADSGRIPHALMLAGKQGIGKSLLLSRMGRDWFNDSITSFDGKEARENLRGV